MVQGGWHEALYARVEAEADYWDARDHFFDARREARECRASDWPRRFLAPLDREVSIWGHICRKRRANARALLRLEQERRAAFGAEVDIEYLVESFYGSEQYDRLAAELRHLRGAVEEMNVALPVLRRLGEIVHAIIFDPNTTPHEQATREACAPWLRWDQPGGGRDEFNGPGAFFRPLNTTLGLFWEEIPGPDGLTQLERAQAIADARAKKAGKRTGKVKTKIGQAK